MILTLDTQLSQGDKSGLLEDSLGCRAIEGSSNHVTLEDVKSFIECLHLSRESLLKLQFYML